MEQKLQKKNGPAEEVGGDDFNSEPMPQERSEEVGSSSNTYSKGNKLVVITNENADFEPLPPTVTLSEDGLDDENQAVDDALSSSPLSKLKASQSPLPVDSDGSYWAMMERYIEGQRKAGKVDGEEGTNTVSTDALAALLNMSIETAKHDTPVTRTPGKTQFTTPTRFYQEWQKEGPTATPGSLLRDDMVPSDDEYEKIRQQTDEILDAPTPTSLSPLPVSPKSVSPFSTFKSNSSHIALDETKAYLKRIMELQEDVQSAQNQVKEEARRREEAELKCQRLQLQLLQATSPHAPTTPKASTPRTPMSDSLWERNKTLVKEVRFADQTCVELSEQKRALEKEVELLQETCKSTKDEMTELTSQLADKTKLHIAVEAQLEMTGKRIERMEQDLSESDRSRVESERKLAELVENQRSTQAELQDAAKRAADAEAALSDTKKSLMQSEKTVLDLESELSDAQKALAQSERLHEALSSEIEQQFQQQASAVTKDEKLKKALEENEILSDKLTEALRNAKDARANLDEMERSKMGMEDELTSLRDQLVKIHNDESALLSDLRLKYERASLEISNLVSENDRMRTLDTNARVELEKLSTILQEKDGFLKKVEQKVDTLQSQLHQSETELEKTEQQRGALAQELGYFMTKQKESEEAQANLVLQLRTDLEKSKEEFIVVTRDLGISRDELVHQKEISRATRLELEECMKSKVELEQMSLTAKADELTKNDLEKKELKSHMLQLENELRGSAKDLQNAKARQEELVEAKSDLEEEVSKLRLREMQMMEDLEQVNTESHARLADMDRRIQEKEAQLVKAEERLTASTEESRTLMARIAGSVKVASAELDGERWRMEEKVKILCSRLQILTEKVNLLQSSNDHTISVDKVDISADSTKQNEHVSSTPYSQALLSRGGTTVYSELLGTMLLSPSLQVVNEVESPTAQLLSKTSPLNMTCDLERMEEAREKTPTTNCTSMHSIAGISHILDSTFLSVSDATPSKNPVDSPNDQNRCDSKNLKEKNDLVEGTENLEREKSALHDRNESSQDQAPGKDVSKASCHSDLSSQEEQYLRLVENLQSVRTRYDKVQLERDLMFAEKSTLTEQVAVLEERCKTSESLLATLENQMQGASEDLPTMPGESAVIAEISKLLDCSAGEELVQALHALIQQNKMLQENTDSYISMMEEKTKEIHHLTDALSLAQKRATDLQEEREAEINGLNMKLVDIGNERERIMLEAQESYEARVQETARCEHLLVENKAQRESIVKDHLRCQQLEETVRSKSSQIEALELRIQQHMADNREVESKYQSICRELEENSKTINKLKEKESLMHAKTCEADELRKRLQDSNSKLLQANGEISSLQSALDESGDAIQRLKSSLIECNEKLTKTTKSQQSLLVEVESLKSLNQNTEERVLSLGAQVEKEQQWRKATEIKNQEMTEALNIMKTEIQSYRKLEIMLKEKEDKIQSITLLNEEYALQVWSLTAQLKQCHNESAISTTSLQKEITQLNERVDSLTEEKTAAQGNILILTKEVEEKELAMKDQSFALAESTNKCRRLKEYATKLIRKCEEWESFSERQTSLISELREAREKSKLKASEMEQRCRERDQVSFFISGHLQLNTQTLNKSPSFHAIT